MSNQTGTDLETLQALNRDYINSVHAGDVGRFAEIAGGGLLLLKSGRLAGRPQWLSRTDGETRDHRQGNTWKAVSAHVTRG